MEQKRPTRPDMRRRPWSFFLNAFQAVQEENIPLAQALDLQLVEARVLRVTFFSVGNQQRIGGFLIVFVVLFR